MRSHRPRYAVTALALLVVASVAFADKPIPVSPGRPDQVAQSAQRCPTFSWSLAPQAAGYRLVVYRVPEDRQAEPEAVIQQDLPAATSSWTPGLSQCLAPGATYAWRVAAVPVDGDAVWSEPSWFGVTAETAVVSDRLVDLVAERLLLRRQEEGERGGTPAGVRPAGAVPAPTIRVHAAAGPGVAFSVGSTGNVVGGAFFGDGSNLTGLNASALASGTVPSAALSGTYANALTLSNASNSFTGNGSGLTNLNLTGIGGLTSGGVVFGSPTGTLAQSPTQLFWDQTNNRLGIGTSAPTQQLELTRMMRMPMTTATAGVPSAGVLFLGADRFLHTYGPASDARNTFVGQQAGNFTMGGEDQEGTYNTATGYQSLFSTTTGYENTAIGASSLSSNTTGFDNTASGVASLFFNTTGTYNTASGVQSLWSNTTGSNNTASGFHSLYFNTTGSLNTASGGDSLQSNTTGDNNTASGYGSLFSNTTGNYNTASGSLSLSTNTTGINNTASGMWSLASNTTGSGNIAVGSSAGYYLTTGSYNIDIGNLGEAGEGNTIRVGNSNQTRAFIAGIRGVTPGLSDGLPVIIDSNGQLGTSAGGGAVSSVFGRTGAVTAQTGDYSASQITGLVAGGVAFGGTSPGPIAQDAANLFWDATNHRLGIGTNAPNQQLELSGMMRMPMTAATAGAPTAGVLFLGTDRFLHNYGPWPGDAGNTFVGQFAGNFRMGGTGSAGKYNTGIGTWSLSSNTTGYHNTASGHYSLAFNTTGSFNTVSGTYSLNSNTTGSDNTASGAYTLLRNTTGSDNTASGYQTLFYNTTGSDNTASGSQSLWTNATGSANTASGFYSLYSNTTGFQNTASGYQSLAANTTGYYNTAIGSLSLSSNLTGGFNIAVGVQAGYNLTTGSYNIDIGNLGEAGEGNTIRIGDSNQTRAFIAGIRGVTPGLSDGLPVIIASNGQLGTSASVGAVSSVFGRTGAVAAQTGDYSAAQITGLTAGGVTFGGAAGAFAQDNSNFYWDASNHRLGLGTTTPAYQLDLTGMLRMPVTAATSGTATAGVLLLGLDSFLHGYSHIGSEGGNTFVGRSAGNFTMGGPNDWDGSYNTAVGQLSLAANTTGPYNTASGLRSLYSNTTGGWNTASGLSSLYNNTTGSYNTAIGSGAGSNLTTGSYNIDIGNNGVAGEGGTIRIGTAGNQTKAYVAGIRGVTPGVSDGLAVIIDSNGQLGTSTSIGAVTSVFGRTGAVTAQTGDYSAAQVTNVPAGTISATDVQGALNGLDTSKATLSHTHWGQSWTGSGVGLTLSGGTIGVNAAGSGYGVAGASSAGGGIGVYGSGASRGVYGTSVSGVGVYGSSSDSYGVSGTSTNSYGVYGNGTTGVYGSGTTGVFGSGTTFGVYGYCNNNWAVVGHGGVLGTSTDNYGVRGDSTNSYGVVGNSQYSYSGYFFGTGYFGGSLTKAGGGFKIDHPLDPANRYLYHSFVESPDMKNVYDGVVTTDAEGRSVVELPAWFEALNRDFRYQLTVIGQFAQAIVAREIENNSFAIKTDKPNVKVSWQVTGIRQDPWANAHRLPVEEEKPGVERGSYLHPDVYSQPEEKSIEWATHPEMMRRMKAEQEKAAPAQK